MNLSPQEQTNVDSIRIAFAAAALKINGRTSAEWDFKKKRLLFYIKTAYCVVGVAFKLETLKDTVYIKSFCAKLPQQVASAYYERKANLGIPMEQAVYV